MIDSIQSTIDLSEFDFISIVLILIATWIFIRGAQWLLPTLANQLPNRFRFYLLPLAPALQLVVVLSAMLGILVLLIKPNAEELLATFWAATIALSFAFQDYLSSLIAGMVTIYERPYRPGDWVEVEGTYGEVQSIGFRAMKMLTPDDTIVSVPHKKLWDSLILNSNDGQPEHMCVAEFFLHPNHDAAQVQEKLYDIAMTSPYLQLRRPVGVTVSEKPWGTHYKLKAYPVDGRDQYKFTTDLTVRGKSAVSRLGLQWAVVQMGALPA